MVTQVDCTPQAVQELTPCFHCLSESQLRMVMMIFWAELAGYDLPEDLDQFLEDSKCFTCLSEKQILEQKVGLFAEFLGQRVIDAEQGLEAFKCLPCLRPRQIEAGILYAICTFLNDFPAL